MFSGSFAEASQELIELPMEESADVFAIVLDFIYTDAASALCGDNVEDVLSAATRW
jgi:hypothetical protein